MSHEAILRWLRATPFQPFRFILSNGSHYDILHPELVVPGRSAINIGLPDNPNEALADRMATVSLIHIAEVVPLMVGLVTER